MKPQKKHQELLDLAAERFKTAEKAEREERDEALDDIKFAMGEQWDEADANARRAEGRPVLTINRIMSFVDQVVGDIRQTKIGIKTKPVDSKSDPEISEILDGLIRNIEYRSNAQAHYQVAAENQVMTGYGVLRVLTEYEHDGTFDQEILVKSVANPFSVYFDPEAVELDGSDAKWVFAFESIPQKAFKESYPDAEISTMPDVIGTKWDGWYHDDTVRVAEYWYKQAKKRTLCQCSDGSKIYKDEIDEEAQMLMDERQVTIDKEREVEEVEVWWCKIAGDQMLEKPQKWAGKLIPFARALGKVINIEGKMTRRGIIRQAKDPQRLYNYWRTAGAEYIALQPKTPYIVTPAQIQGYEHVWREANKATLPFLPFNPDPQAPGKPQREQAPQGSPAIFNEAMSAADDMKAVTGIYDASLGNKSNEQSGKAIIARQRESDNANFVFIDNLSLTIAHIGRIIIDLTPHIYDTNRVVRIIGEDEQDETVEINKPEGYDLDGNPLTLINDLTVGRYDIQVTTGPSYGTARQEATEFLLEFLKVFPPAAPLLADLLMKNADVHDSDDMSERLASINPYLQQQKQAEMAQQNPGVPQGGAPVPMPPQGGPPVPAQGGPIPLPMG